jgi:hypothetical protein
MPVKTKDQRGDLLSLFCFQNEAGMDMVNGIFNQYRAKQGF